MKYINTRLPYFVDKGKASPTKVMVDLEVESFGNIEEANMVWNLSVIFFRHRIAWIYERMKEYFQPGFPHARGVFYIENNYNWFIHTLEDFSNECRKNKNKKIIK